MAKDTRGSMLEATARLLQHRGYFGTSLSDILAASGAPRGSLYFHFPGGKDQLVIEATRAAADEATNELRRALAVDGGPGYGVRLYAEAAAEIMQERDFTFGCPVAPVILDAAGDVSALAELCRATLDGWRALLVEAFTAIGLEAERATALATTTIAAIEGALIIVRSERDTAALRVVAFELQRLIEAATPASTARP